MQIFNDIKELEEKFIEEHKQGRKLSDLYESVQQASGVLQRLYLLILVGSARIQTKEAKAKEIIQDLIEMVKGIQHPLRGLFLRYFMLKKLKDKLPDTGYTEKNPKINREDGDTNDSINFLFQNLIEMNRLWIRMQHTKEKEILQRDFEINMLVGENLVRLSGLSGVDLGCYTRIVLPRLFDLIQKTKNPMSQQYLLDCIIQVFTDNFHLQTLEILLDTSNALQNNVDIKAIFITLMKRLANFAESQKNEIINTEKTIDLFNLFKKYIDKIIGEQGVAVDLNKILELQVAFLTFSVKAYSQNKDFVNIILDSCLKIMQLQPLKNVSEDCQKILYKFLVIPLDKFSLSVLDMANFPVLMQYLNPVMQKQIAKQILLV